MTPDDPLLERYREANGLDPARPAPSVRENVLARARSLEKAPPGNARPAAANDAAWRWRAIGGLAVLGLATLVVLQFDRDAPVERGARPRPAESMTPSPAPAQATAPATTQPAARAPSTPKPSAAQDRSADTMNERAQARSEAQGALSREVDVDTTDAQGRTELMRAAQQGDIARVRRLLEAGADPLRRDHQGRNAADLAREAGHGAVLPLLEAERR
jgi:hypothetical protein